MKKMIVQTTGDFGLGDFQSRQEIHAFRPSVVKPSQFLASRIGLGQVNILVDDLPVEANDEDFHACLLASDGDVDLALDSYTAEVCIDPEQKAQLIADAKEAEDKAAKEAEDKATKEAEDKAAKEAEDKAAKEAEDKAATKKAAKK